MKNLIIWKYKYSCLETLPGCFYKKRQNFFFKNVFFSSFQSVDKYLTTVTRSDALSSVCSSSRPNTSKFYKYKKFSNVILKFLYFLIPM